MKSFRIAALLAAFFLVVSVGFAAVPDELRCEAQPAKITADGSSITEVTAQLFTEEGQPVRMCGIEIKCESQNPDIVHNGQNGGLLTGLADHFGKATFDFVSGGDREANIGSTNIICRTLQQESCTIPVETITTIPEKVDVSACPYVLNRTLADSVGDILADGNSSITVYAQLQEDTTGSMCPVPREGIIVKFVSLNTNIVRECTDVGSDGLDIIRATTNSEGVASAVFCSAGSGSENVGTGTIRIEPDGGFAVPPQTLEVVTTDMFGTTTLNGNLTTSIVPGRILADGTSTLDVCVQLRDKVHRIIKNKEQVVSMVSHDTSVLRPVVQSDMSNPGYTETSTSGGIAIGTFVSSGAKYPENVGTVDIEVSAEFMTNAEVIAETASCGLWPSCSELTATLNIVGCDGDQTVKATAQLVDHNGLPVHKAGDTVVFKSSDISLLKDAANGDNTVEATTDAQGVATALFQTTDCKFGGVDGTALINATTISPLCSVQKPVTVVKLDGHVPTNIRFYTDQMLDLGTGTGNLASHAVPSLISADGEKPISVTVQLCELEVDVNDYDGDSDFTEQFCNPVKRPNVLIEFDVLDDSIVQNKDDGVGGAFDDNQNAVEQGIDYVKIMTDNEGRARAVFRSSGTTYPSNVGCTDILAEAVDGSSLGSAYARVCVDQDENTVPNAAWVWAESSYVTADGTSPVDLTAALYWCDSAFLANAADMTQENPTGANPLARISPDDLDANCKPVQLEGAQVKFEVTNPQIIDDGFGGYKIITTTDQYGHAHSTFFSSGFDTQHIGKTNVEVFIDHIGEDITQLNTLIVRTEEKTWPWCSSTPLTGGAAEADTDNDQFISDSELLSYVLGWFNGSLDPAPDIADQLLVDAVVAWLAQ